MNDILDVALEQRLGGADGELIDALCEEITRLRNKEALVTSSDKWIVDHDQQVRDAALKDAAEQCRQIAEWNNDISEYQQAAEWCRDLILEMRVAGRKKAANGTELTGAASSRPR